MTGPRLATQFSAAEDSPGLLLWQVTNRWQAAQRAALKEHGLTHVQFVLLASLAWLAADGPVTQRQLADHAATDPMMTSQVVRALEELGLLTRLPHPDDKRARALAVTPAGRAPAPPARGPGENGDAAGIAPHRTCADDRNLPAHDSPPPSSLTHAAAPDRGSVHRP